MITASDLFCLYTGPAGTVAALRGLSLDVASGERLVVHGPNGSGKSTLLRVLSGEQPPSAGTVRVAGVDLAGAGEVATARLRRRCLGIVDQHSARTLRPELDVVDNVALQLRLAGRRRQDARTRAQDLLIRLGLDGLADRRTPTLSGGEAQRVAVCAALAHSPQVVLADEPTGELDAEAADEVYDLLAAAVSAADATLLLVTHDPRAARIADRVVRIRDGRLSEQWTPADPEGELLVVDDRGWLRLPEQLRKRTGSSFTMRAAERDGAVVLNGGEPPTSEAVTIPRRTAGAPIATARSITVAYGGRTVLDRVHLDVRAGALTVVRGRSGSGKSTLLRILLGLADPDYGTAALGGTELGALDRPRRADLRRAHVAVAAQSGALAEPLDVVENLALARRIRGLGPSTVADVVEALGLASLTGRPVRLVSGGERQRVAVARCLVVDRPLIVLDEPTSQQDEVHAELVTAALAQAAASGMAVLAASHDPVLVAQADLTLDLS